MKVKENPASATDSKKHQRMLLVAEAIDSNYPDTLHRRILATGTREECRNAAGIIDAVEVHFPHGKELPVNKAIQLHIVPEASNYLFATCIVRTDKVRCPAPTMQRSEMDLVAKFKEDF